MNKLIILIMGIVLVLPFAAATDIAYIVKDSSHPDAIITGLINEANYTYNIIDDSQIASTSFSQYKMILVGEGNFRNDAFKIPVNRQNSVILNSIHLADWNWTSDGLSSI